MGQTHAKPPKDSMIDVSPVTDGDLVLAVVFIAVLAILSICVIWEMGRRRQESSD